MKYKEKSFLIPCAVYLCNKATACDNGLYIQLKHPFLGAFVKLRKATTSFVICARMEQLGSHWTDFHEI